MTETPAVGTAGRVLEIATHFDGWGYAHLYRNSAGKLGQLDAYAIPEALDPELAADDGDLSIHEFTVDSGDQLACSSYYAGGLRVFSFGARGLEEVGRFIDERGNNFWGVEFDGDQDLIATSDRDFGL